MKPSVLLFFLWISITGGLWSCSKNENNLSINKMHQNTISMSNKLRITINGQSFTAILLDNDSVKAFKEMLPMTITMFELNGNEKYYDLSKDVPTNSLNFGTIQNGDLMLYGSNTLVLFYKTFSTSYSYTKLGRIDDPSSLLLALGSGKVTVAFEML